MFFVHIKMNKTPRNVSKKK